MKIKEVYKKIEEKRQVDKPQNVYDELWKIDKYILDNVYSNALGAVSRELQEYKYGESDDLEVMLEKKYEDIYVYGVCAKIDFDYQDTESYANNMAMYNNLLNEMACEYRRNYRQKNNYEINW